MRIAILSALAVAAFLWVIGQEEARAQADPCAALASRAEVTSAESNAATEAKGPGGAKGKAAPAAPAHCEVLGQLNERTGTHGQRYAIQFHLRLPTQWNGKFFFEGGGGSNGNVGQAFGNLQGGQRGNALSLGYAVVSQDSGHSNAVNNDPARGGTATFGFDPQARLDFGYRSYELVARTAKEIIQAHYGRAPQRSYYAGCSEGGREGMVVSQRFPEMFDGVLACAPGLSLHEAALFGHAWDVQSFAEVALAAGIHDRFGQPLLNKSFTDEDLDIAVNAVLAACDAIDGLEDGVIDAFMSCTTQRVQPKLAEATCRGPKRVTCLSAAQVTALTKVFEGARDASGKPYYSDWAWDRGFGGKLGNNYNQGWRSWKIGAYDAPNNGAIITGLGSGSVSSLFTTPPTEVATQGGAPVAFLRSIDLARDAAKLTATSGEYTTPVAEFMRADSTGYRAFSQRGSKLIVVHGVSDPVFSIKDTLRWWTETNAASNGAASNFARVFAVPGMNHCAGGPATDQFDAFTALVNWVEQGKAPESITATAGPNTPWPGRTRPLCPYPSQARYKGSGSIEDAANFTCALP